MQTGVETRVDQKSGFGSDAVPASTSPRRRDRTPQAVLYRHPSPL